jgi:hypothetical protein
LNYRLYLFFFFLVISFFSFSQDVISSRFLRNIGFNVNIIKGYDFSARGRNGPTRNIEAIGYEFDLIYRTDGQKDWQKLYNEPRAGISLSNIYMPTKWLYGNIYSAMPYMNFNLLNKPAIMAFLKIGVGIAYMNKQFDTSSTINAQSINNNLISQSYNLGIQIGFGIHQKLFSNTELALEAGVLNFSNGSLNAPNNGINLAYLKGGLNFFLYDRINHRGMTTFHNDQTKKWYLQTFFGTAYTKIRYPLKTEYDIYVISTQLMYSKNKILNIGPGIDFYYDPTSNIRLLRPASMDEIAEADKLKVAMGLSAEFNIGRISIPMRGMHYVYNLANVRVDRIYYVFGLRYTHKSNLFIQGSLKSTLDNTTGVRTDFIEYGIGYRFKTKSTYGNTY